MSVRARIACGLVVCSFGCTSATSDESDAAESAATDEAAPPMHLAATAPGTPLTGPDRKWAWVDVNEAICGNGSSTGLGINLTNASDDVVVFLEGGGACWDAKSCWGVVPSSFNMKSGYGEFAWHTDPQRILYVLSRSNGANPFRDKNLVYVPYCTGDVYGGDNVTTLTYAGVPHETHFVGRRNIQVYLDRLVKTFPNAKRVWVVGDSAGGFGAAISFPLFQDAFKSARVDVLDDSGQPIDPAPATWKKWRDAWNLHGPAGCADCDTSPTAYVDYYRKTYPNSRFGLISFQYDLVISPFMGLSLSTFHTELMALADRFDTTWPNGHYYVMKGASHVGLMTPSSGLKQWIKEMVNDDPDWGNVRP